MAGEWSERRFDPSEASDLRRRRRAEIIERVLRRLDPLPDRDRLLVESIYRDGRSAVEVSRLMGAPTRTVRRRVRRIVARVLSDRFVFVLSQRDAWPVACRRVADACFIEGRSLREAAEDLRLSLHQVRRHWVGIEAMYATWRAMPRASRREAGRLREAARALRAGADE